jgi:hypothetical protein
MNLSNDIVHSQIVSAPPGNAYSNTINPSMANFTANQSSFGQNMSGGGSINLKKQKKIVFEILKILCKSYSKNKKINIHQVIDKKTKKKSK